MGSGMLLSVLDQSPVRSGLTAVDAIQETLDLAVAAERLGYHRYWLAEHHSSSGLAGSSPEVLIGQVAARTSRLRVGSAGIMLSHYSPLKTAEQFRTLEVLFPGRIDLGLGRAPGSDQLTAQALAYGARRGPELYPRQVMDLIAWLEDTLPEDHAFAGVKATPRAPGMPEIWLLGSSDESAQLAAHFGAAFSFAHFISSDGSVDAMRLYRERFTPSARLAAPRSSAAVFVVCADTEAEAHRLARSRELFIVRLYTGRGGPYPSVDEAEKYPYTVREQMIVDNARRRSIAGAPEQVRAQLERFAREHQADELVIVTITQDAKSRLRSYELIAEVFGLR
jgi:luciferase family oxidoreductase group 1